MIGIMPKPLRIAVLGMGMMGRTHLDVYARRRDVRVVTVATRTGRPLRTGGGGNIAGQAQGSFDLSGVRRSTDAMALAGDPEVDVVDICLPTPDHVPVALAAVRAGKHVLVEKPLALDSRSARTLARAAAQSGRVAMVALCMRFWPGWDWLKRAIDGQTYGGVRSAHFSRLCAHPGPTFADPIRTGGALLDLHVHDTDFVTHCFGLPRAVSSRGVIQDAKGKRPAGKGANNAIDHVTTQYLFDSPLVVTAEGGWMMSPGFAFTMRYLVNFERATAVFDLANGASPLTLYHRGKSTQIRLPAGLGYAAEIDYFLRCVRRGEPAERASVASAVESLRVVEAERRSVISGKPAAVRR